MLLIVNGVDQGLAIGLRQQGIENIEQLLSHFSSASLAEFVRPWGKGYSASRLKGQPRFSGWPSQWPQVKKNSSNLPISRSNANYLMFDLEGLPPHLDELEKIYLWGHAGVRRKTWQGT